MKVYLLTTGTGQDGDEWAVESIHATQESAENERRRRTEIDKWFDGDIEEWEVNP